MTPNELADALSDEAMLASKRAAVLRALDYSDEAAILRDTVADELDRQSARLLRMFALALPDEPIAEPAGGALLGFVSQHWQSDITRDESVSVTSSPDEAHSVPVFVGRLAQPQRHFPNTREALQLVVDEPDHVAVEVSVTAYELRLLDAAKHRQGRAVVEQKDCPKCTQASYQREAVYRECLCGKYAATGGYRTEQLASAAVADGWRITKRSDVARPSITLEGPNFPSRTYGQGNEVFEVIDALGIARSDDYADRCASEMLAAAPDRSQSGGA